MQGDRSVMSLPNDPFILLSVINTRLRDFYSSLEECCKAESTDPAAIREKLAAVGYIYSSDKNQFIHQ